MLLNHAYKCYCQNSSIDTTIIMFVQYSRLYYIMFVQYSERGRGVMRYKSLMFNVMKFQTQRTVVEF